MKNVVLWRFHDESLHPAILSLQARKIIEIKAWIGDKYKCPHCTHDRYSLFRGTFHKPQYSSYDWNVYTQVYKSIYKYIDMYSTRKFMYYRKPFHDYLHMFNMHFNIFYKMLTDENVDLVLFSYIPHEGPELVLFEIAKALGIETILFYQTIFPDKFFYLKDIKELGEYKHKRPLFNPPEITIEKRFEKELFYMKKKPVVKTRKLKSADVTKWARSIKKLPAKLEALDWAELVLSKLVRCYRRRKYKKQLAQNSADNDASLDVKYVYFPLHLQPELTTSALGDVFDDQILAVEKLRDMLPDDWYIYVKENPKQTEMMRPDGFFERLNAIKNVKLFSPKFDTYSLLKNSAFVATITGTAGWEAISGGKNVVVFGYAWYKQLPGVFLYNEELKLTDILSYNIDHDLLVSEWKQLMSIAADGVTDLAYRALIPNFDIEENSRKIADFLAKIINEEVAQV